MDLICFTKVIFRTGVYNKKLDENQKITSSYLKAISHISMAKNYIFTFRKSSVMFSCHNSDLVLIRRPV